MARSRQYKRTCRDCGSAWFVPKEIADRDVKYQGRLAKNDEHRANAQRMMSFGKRGGGGGTQLQIKAQARRDKIAETQAEARCRSCGSMNFTQVEA
jgi:hypothetical protein